MRALCGVAADLLRLILAILLSMPAVSGTSDTLDISPIQDKKEMLGPYIHYSSSPAGIEYILSEEGRATFKQNSSPTIHYAKATGTDLKNLSSIWSRVRLKNSDSLVKKVYIFDDEFRNFQSQLYQGNRLLQ